jgi:hypothetical protein
LFSIGEATIDDAVGTASFRCDLAKCKGACCTMPGGRGAPLSDLEVLELQRAFPAAMEFLSQQSRDAIETMGMVEGAPGSFATTCIDNCDCVFVYYEGEVAKCSLERAYNEGKTDWKKPLSCHLFPIRVRAYGGDHLRYVEIDVCEPARDFGKATGTRLHDFLKEPLIRYYGEEWYESFVSHCKNHL